MYFDNFLKNNFGSKQGFVIYCFHKIIYLLGGYRKYSPYRQGFKPKRLVYVCAGNICRSPLGEVVAKSLGAKTSSFGLDTRGNDSADPRAIEYAKSLGLDLTTHRTTRAEDYVAEEGDLIIAMEPKHLKLHAQKGIKTPIVLLGLADKGLKGNPYLHDPYCTNPVAFAKIEAEVVRLTRVLVANG